MSFFPTHIHTKYSILDGIIKIPDLMEKCKELGYKSCSITDHGNLSGAFQFIEECEKNDIKPIIGSEFYISRLDSSIKTEENRGLKHLVLLAKNKTGYFELVKLTSKANRNMYYKPRLSMDDLQKTDNIVALTGHPGSLVGDLLGGPQIFSVASVDEGRALITEDRLDAAEGAVLELRKRFDTYLEVQLFNASEYPGLIALAEAIREVGKRTNTKCIACMDAHYLNASDAEIQRIALSSMLKMTLPDIDKKIKAGEKVSLSGFFTSDKYYVYSTNELLECGNTQEEIDNVGEIDSMCEAYSLKHPPRLPKFSNEDDYKTLLKLCREGWLKRKTNTWDIDLYGARVNKELRIIKRTNLSAYFLIVADFINHMKREGWIIGPGRGSAGGSLVAYLLGITEIDPIKYDLIFERFFNPGRVYTDHISFDEFRYLEDFYE